MEEERMRRAVSPEQPCHLWPVRKVQEENWEIHIGKGEAVRKQNRTRFAASADTRLKCADTGRCASNSLCPRCRRCRRVMLLCSRYSSKRAGRAKACFLRIPHRVQSSSVVSEE